MLNVNKERKEAMTIYEVINQETKFYEQFYTLTDAKKAMKENNARGYKTKVYANGDWIPCGEIELKGRNDSFIANSPRRMKKTNY